MMKTKSIIFIVIFIGSIYSGSVQAQFAVEPPTLNIPPTNAFQQVGTQNGTIYANNFYYPLNVTGSGCVNVQGSNASHTMIVSGSGCQGSNSGTYNTTQANNVNVNTGGFKINFLNGTGNGVNVQNSQGGQQINVTISTGTTITPLTCTLNSQLHSVSGGGVFTCAPNNSTGSGSTLDTMQNIGHGGSGFYAGNNTNTNFQFKNLTSLRTDLFIINHNSTDVTIDSLVKMPDKNCGAGNFLQVWTNTTGFTCAAGSIGTITTASNIGTGGFGFFRDVTGTSINLRNLTTSRSDLFTITQNTNNVNLASSFKSNTITCTNQFLSAFNNATGLYTCTSGNSGTITSSQNVGKGTGSVGVLASPTSSIIKGKNVTSSGDVKISGNTTDITITGTGKYVLLDNHQANKTESTYTFTPSSALTNSTYSKIVFEITGLTSATLAMQIQFDGDVSSNYAGQGLRSVAGTGVGVNGGTTNAAASLCSISTITAAGSITIDGQIFIPTSTSQKIMGMANCYDITSNVIEQTNFGLSAAHATITSITYKTSTSTWASGTKILTYGVLD